MSYTIPTVVEASGGRERVTDIYSRLLGERIVFVGTPIDDGVANVVIAQLLHLAAVDPTRDISLYLNSPGGSYTAVMAVYDTMRFVAADIATLCVGQAASSAAVLLAAGTPGKRGILPHARVLLHQPHAEMRRGAMSDLAVEAAELARMRGEAESILAAHSGRTDDEVRADTDRALVLAGPAAVTYGIADFVTEPQAIAPPPGVARPGHQLAGGQVPGVPVPG
mgnify:FL=1